jgi:hypothetical protein
MTVRSPARMNKFSSHRTDFRGILYWGLLLKPIANRFGFKIGRKCWALGLKITARLMLLKVTYVTHHTLEPILRFHGNA